MQNSACFEMPASRTERYRDLPLEAIYDNELVIIPESSTEQRGKLSLWGEIRNENTRDYLLISDVGQDSIQVSKNGAQKEKVYLSDEDSLSALLGSNRIIMDISGLAHHVWVPILNCAYNNKNNTRIVYAEPESYKLHKSPASSTLFDLSKEFLGMAPLPGLAQLYGPESGDKCIFVALLGFEGSRPRSLLLNIDHEPEVVIPIVGVPGFQMEFPTYTITCNKDLLDDFNSHCEIRFARASCPFETYNALKEIRRYYPDCYLYIAPVGTKPHGLGAILYSIANKENTEILFDHPVRKVGRTRGVGAIHVYDFGIFDDF